MNIFAEAVVCASLLFFFGERIEAQPQLGMNNPLHQDCRSCGGQSQSEGKPASGPSLVFKQ